MKYNKPKGSRLKRVGFRSATVFLKGYWTNFSSHSIPIRLLRAFRRRLKQWGSQLPKGTKVWLCSQWKNFGIIGVIQ
jgi:hypothetical protein